LTTITFSYSRLRTLDCWRKHHLQYNVGLKPLHRFAALNFGTVWDAAQDAYWSKSHPEVRSDSSLFYPLQAGYEAIGAETKRVDALLRERGLERPESLDDDTAQMRYLFERMLDNYFEHWQTDNQRYEVLANQLRIQTPLPSRGGKRSSNRYHFVGVIDRVVKDVETGRVLIVDAKTCKDLNEDYRAGYDNDLQLPLYVWAAQNTGWTIDGVMIDAAAKRLPHKPLLRATPMPVLDAQGNEIFDPVLDEAGNPGVFVYCISSRQKNGEYASPVNCCFKSRNSSA